VDVTRYHRSFFLPNRMQSCGQIPKSLLRHCQSLLGLSALQRMSEDVCYPFQEVDIVAIEDPGSIGACNQYSKGTTPAPNRDGNRTDHTVSLKMWRLPETVISCLVLNNDGFSFSQSL
jgi:hypothetical protein